MFGIFYHANFNWFDGIQWYLPKRASPVKQSDPAAIIRLVEVDVLVKPLLQL